VWLSAGLLCSGQKAYMMMIMMSQSRGVIGSDVMGYSWVSLVWVGKVLGLYSSLF